jgi:hypothetical protein
MTTPFDSSTDHDYLWDPTATPEPTVAALEERVQPLRFNPALRPLVLPARVRRRSHLSPAWRAALLAAALIVATTSVFAWRWTWPEGRAWQMRSVSTDDAGSRISQLVVGEPLSVEVGNAVRVDVARIGSMDILGDSVLTLRSTASNRHRLTLARGTVDLRLWAPPGALSLRTPAGDVIDLGCVFQVSVDALDVTRVSVDTGWVQLDNPFGEMLVPAGTSSEMHAGRAPMVPVYGDAAAPFRDGVRALEHAAATGTTDNVDLSFLQLARPRDVYTLLHLARTAPAGTARLIVERAAILVPPPATITPTDVLMGERDALWRWIDTLDLPAPKNWWRNWRDGFTWFR